MINFSQAKRLKKVLFIILFVFVFGLLFQPCLAQLEQLQEVGKEANLGETKIPVLVGNIIEVVFGLMGILLVGLILAGGFMWMTSGGNPEKIKKAQGMLKNALIGLIIIVLAYSISVFVLEKLQEVTQEGTSKEETSNN
jgi:uncharacterized membrane protein